MNFHHPASKKPESDPFATIPVGESVETDWAAWEELITTSDPAGTTHRPEVFPKETTYTA